MTDNLEIVRTEQTDLNEIRDIYAYYVMNTCACLDEIVPDKSHFISLLEELNSKKLPFYIGRLEGKVIGYCYANLYRQRSAYRYTVETSIYIHPEYTGRGLARKLFQHALDEVQSLGYKQMVAVVVNQESGFSDKFHKDMGFVEAGKLTKVGFKFNKWLDVYLLQKEL